MSTGSITVVDNEDGSVNVNVNFGEEGCNEDSAAHAAVVEMLRHFGELCVQGEEDSE